MIRSQVCMLHHAVVQLVRMFDGSDPHLWTTRLHRTVHLCTPWGWARLGAATLQLSTYCLWMPVSIASS